MSGNNNIIRITEERLVNAVVGRTVPRLTKHSYALMVESYAEELRDILDSVQQYCNENPEIQKELIDTIANALLRAIEANLKPLSKVGRVIRQQEYLMFVVTLFSPALLKLKSSVGNDLCEAVRFAWQTVWPKQNYQIATEEMISAGFDRKWYKCYST